MSEFSNIPPVGIPCPVPVLPTVFDDSLSYYELLAKLWQQVNELTALVNSETETVNSLIERIETDILPLLPRVENLEDATADLLERLGQLRADHDALELRLYKPTSPDPGDIVTMKMRLDDLENGAIKSEIVSGDLFTTAEGKYRIPAENVWNVDHIPPTLAALIIPPSLDFPSDIVLSIRQTGLVLDGVYAKEIYLRTCAAGDDVLFFAQQLVSTIDPTALVWDDWSLITSEVDPNT